MTTPQRYSYPAIALHWLIALLIIFAFVVGLKVSDMPLSPAKFRWIAWHKWAGITVLAFAAIRLLVRLSIRPPALPTSMSKPAQLMAHAGHLALYVLMFAVPMSGWFTSSAYGFPVVLFQLVPLPDLIAPNPKLALQLRQVHETLDWILAACVVGHVLAAIKHHFIDKDGLLWRMSFKQPR